MNAPLLKKLFSTLSPALALTLTLTLTLAIAPVDARADGMGYVDARRLINKAPQGRDEIESLEAEFAERRRELNGKFDLFKAQEDDLSKNGVLMEAEELAAKTTDLQEEQRQLQRAQREYNEDYARRRNERLSKLEKMITEVIVEVAKREKLDVVFQQVIYASPTIDLTDKVLAELTRRHQ